MATRRGGAQLTPARASRRTGTGSRHQRGTAPIVGRHRGIAGAGYANRDGWNLWPAQRRVIDGARAVGRQAPSGRDVTVLNSQPDPPGPQRAGTDETSMRDKSRAASTARYRDAPEATAPISKPDVAGSRPAQERKTCCGAARAADAVERGSATWSQTRGGCRGSRRGRHRTNGAAFHARGRCTASAHHNCERGRPGRRRRATHPAAGVAGSPMVLPRRRDATATTARSSVEILADADCTRGCRHPARRRLPRPTTRARPSTRRHSSRPTSAIAG